MEKNRGKIFVDIRIFLQSSRATVTLRYVDNWYRGDSRHEKCRQKVKNYLLVTSVHFVDDYGGR